MVLLLSFWFLAKTILAEVTSKSELARLMVGREIMLQIEKQPTEPKQIVLRVKGLSDDFLKNINLYKFVKSET